VQRIMLTDAEHVAVVGKGLIIKTVAGLRGSVTAITVIETVLRREQPTMD